MVIGVCEASEQSRVIDHLWSDDAHTREGKRGKYVENENILVKGGKQEWGSKRSIWSRQMFGQPLVLEKEKEENIWRWKNLVKIEKKTGEGKGGKEKSDDGQTEFPLVDSTPSVAGDEWKSVDLVSRRSLRTCPKDDIWQGHFFVKLKTAP